MADKHYIYPEYNVFDKTFSDENFANTYSVDLFEMLISSAIIAQIDKKPVDLLNDQEKLGIYIGAGIPIKYEDGKYKTLYEVGISLIDDKYRVFCRIPKFNNTYC